MVGKPYRATPIFRSTMTYLVLNPTWTVPPGILANDILPAQRRDRSTLAKKGLEVIDHSGRPVPASSIDWANATPRNFRYMLRQAPGPDNALGRVKFMFPNSYSVYLHDTPSKALFEKSERAFSSGCIRVENPLELAALLLEGQQGWDRAAIDRAVEAGKTRTRDARASRFRCCSPTGRPGSIAAARCSCARTSTAAMRRSPPGSLPNSASGRPEPEARALRGPRRRPPWVRAARPARSPRSRPRSTGDRAAAPRA